MRLSAPAGRPARIEMVPLIDVVFILLVFFTYAMLTMIVPRGLRVTLPSVAGSSRTAREPVAVTIGRRGELYVDREPVLRATLVERVKERLAGAREGWVLIHGDAAAPLEAALDVLGRLRDAGIDEVTFRVGPKPPTERAP